MKKIQLIAIIPGMIFLYANAFGQSIKSDEPRSARPVETHLDLVINLVATNFNYGKANNALADFKKPTLSPQLGVSMQAGITPNFSLVPEFYFMMKGGKLAANNPLTTSKTKLHFYTLEFPLLARFHYDRFYVNAGPSISYSLHGTSEIEDTKSDVSFDNSANGFKRWEAGMQFGGGYNFRIKQRHVALDLRYNYGLTNISHTYEMYNRSFIMSLYFYKPWKTNPLRRNKNA